MSESNLEYRVYTLVPRAEDEPFWFWIGRAFPHKDQKGAFTLRLNALPTTPKLVIRMFDPDAVDEGAASASPQAAKVIAGQSVPVPAKSKARTGKVGA